MTVVSISASYAAGGSELAPRIAERLGYTFVDRAIPVAVARELGITVEEAEAVSHDAPSRLWSMFAAMSPMSTLAGMADQNSRDATDRQLLAKTEARIRAVADEGSCIVLGRAAAVVLADRADTLHVRLDGAIDGRIEAAMAQHGIDRDEATDAQRENDKVRVGYVKHFYQVDPTDPALYHLVLDTVRLGWDRSEELIVHAVQLFSDQTA